MKILHVVAGIDPRTGGVTQAVKMIITGLSEMNIINEVVSLDAPDADFLDSYNFKIYALGPGKSAWRYSRRLKPWLKNNLHRYDCVVVHGLWQYHVHALYRSWARIKIGNKPALYVMPHGMLDPYFQKARERKLKALRNKLFWKLFDSFLVNNADALLFTCETEKILASQTFKSYRVKREEVVGLGIPEAPEFSASMTRAFIEKCGGVDARGCLLFLSRIDPKKGVDILINSYISLYKIRNGDLPRLVIAGPGLDTDFGKSMIAEAGDNSSIIFTGMLSGDSRWGAFYNCSALILPSHQENFGFVVVEAMSCKKPVLISDQVNIWREIDNSKAGYVQPDTQKGTEDLIAGFLSLNKVESDQTGQRALGAFQHFFSLKSSTLRFLSAIRKADL